MNWMRLKRAAERARQRFRHHGLADPGHILDQDVPLARQRHDRQLELGALPDDDFLDIL